MGSENKVVMILANHEFQDTEYSEIHEALRSVGIDVVVAAAVNEECKGTNGLEVSVSLTLDEIDPSQYDGMILIGGVGIEGYLHDGSIHALAKSFLSLNKLLAATSWAPAILAYAGVLNGKRATSWSGAADDLTENGASYTGEPITIDGTVMTAIGPDVACDFGRAIANMILR